MSEERKNLHLSGIGLLRPSDIGGEACEGCEHNQRGESCALVLGSGEALRSCAKLLFKDCELVPVGTKARIAELEKMAEARKLANRLLEQERNELEAERDRMREALVKLKECLEGYFGKTEKDFFEDCNEDSGELYFADVYNVAVNALKKARGEA